MASARQAATAAEVYRGLIEQGWHWAAIGKQTPHLVPPRGDAALCFRPCERGRRQPVSAAAVSVIGQLGCSTCLQKAGLS